MFEIKLFGTPSMPSSDCSLATEAIERAKRQLQQMEYPAYATVTDTATYQIIWTGSLRSDGTIGKRKDP